MLVGITRVRNEALIIEDTVKHFLGYCDHIILYDDCSQDDTVALAAKVGHRRITIIPGEHWSLDRVTEETRHRALLLEEARSMDADWVLCFDADERLVGTLPAAMYSGSYAGFRFRLFDGYMTSAFCDPYRSGPLDELPRLWGPEYRDILMLFTTNPGDNWYRGKDRREPVTKGPITVVDVKVRHYGKCLSIQHWEDTCEYYARYFPKRYRVKWQARKGHAIHTLSDFHRTLYTWRQLMEKQESWVQI